LTLRDVIKTISVTKNPEARELIIDSLLNLTMHGTQLLINSFFHFNGRETIATTKIEAQALTFHFLIATAIKIQMKPDTYPAFFIIETTKQYLYIYVYKGIIMLDITNSGEMEKYRLGEIQTNIWNLLLVFFDQNKVKCIINQKATEQEIGFPKFDNELFFYVGSYEYDVFVGDIGPLIVLPPKIQEKAIRNAKIAVKSHSPSKKFILSFFPCVRM
jgi:hypothetical protein